MSAYVSAIAVHLYGIAGPFWNTPGFVSLRMNVAKGAPRVAAPTMNPLVVRIVHQAAVC